jgi:S-adenosylmethionine/arginine decarboxylase-like enzyme
MKEQIMTETSNTFGWHLILDCANGDIDKTKDIEHITKWIKQLVIDIDMVPYGEPQVFHFGDGNLAGVTALQFITTSNILVHFMDDTGNFYLDCFSCKRFDEQIVIKSIQDNFHPTNIKQTSLTRSA